MIKNILDTGFISDIVRQSIWVLLKISLPILVAALVVGLIISLLQALTQVQEPSLVFVPKMVVVCLMLVLLIPYMGNVLQSYAEELIAAIVQLE